MKIAQFIRAYCARPGKTLTQAPIVETDELILPLESLIHYVSESTLNPGIRQSHPLVRTWDKQIRVHFLEEGKYPHGRTRPRQYNVNTFKQGYFRRNKRFRKSTNLDRSIMADRDLLVMDYSLLPAKVTYSANKNIYIDGWRNTAESIMEQVKAVGNRRNQFLPIQMPSEWVSETAFKSNVSEIQSTYLDVFRDPSLLWIREVYAAIAGESTIFDGVDADSLFFVFFEGRHAIFVSLSTLQAASDSNERSADAAFHDMLEKLLSKRTTTDTEAVEKETEDKDVAAPNEMQERVFPPTLVKQVKDLADAGKLTSAEQKRLGRIAADMMNIDAPIGDKTLMEFAKVDPEEIKLNNELKAPVAKDMVPEDALKSTTAHFKADYIEKLMEKDIANMVMSLNRAGLLLKDYKIDESADALQEIRTYKFSFIPVVGRESTSYIEMPKFNEDGTFTIDGVRYTMDAQKVDMPIRKTKADQAALTSYYGKLFVQRSPMAKHNYNEWLVKIFSAAGINSEDKRIEHLQYGTGVIPNKLLPRDYTALMSTVSSFISGDYHFDFDYAHREVKFGKDVIKALESKGSVVCGTYKKFPLLMDVAGMLSIKRNGNKQELGTILEVTGGDWGTPPRDVAVFKSLGRRVPVVFLLGYYLGLDKLLRYVKAKYRFEPLTQRSSAGPNDVVVPFNNERLIIDVTDSYQSLLWAGLADMDNMTKQYSSSDYNKPAGWRASISYYRANAGHFTEYDLMQELFLDPITIEVLNDMKEPADLIKLMLRCVDLIKTDDAPDEADPKYMRIRGMERISGMIYWKMVEAIREQRRSPNPANQPITLPPSAIKAALNDDSSIQLVSEINPIHNLKEQEAVTLAGEGGRGARTLVKRNRAFHKNDTGILSEHTPDSSKVGIRSFMTPNAKVESLRGTAGDWNPEDGSTSLLSSTGLLLPDMDRDDGKRANLGAVQQSAVVPAVGYEPAPYQTGYGSVIASRVSDFFVFRAKQDGTVKKVTPKVIQVVYADGKKEGYTLGVKHGDVSGAIIPHEYITDLKPGHAFKEGHLLAWNKGFFTRDFFNPNNVSLLTGAMATVALMEGNDTLEDGSAIGENFRKKLTTRISTRKGILIDFEQEVQDLVKVGDHVDFDSSLCTIMEGALSGIEQTDMSLAALGKLGNVSPKAKFAGDITRVELFYNGDIEEMSPSLQELVKADNARRTKEMKDLNTTKAGWTGEVKKPTFVAGEKLIPGTVVISIYIDHDLESSVGDKSVVSNQLKSVHGRVLEGLNETEDGREVDLIFGWRSINDRIVRSCMTQGTMNLVMTEISMSLAKEYMEAGE